MKRLITLCIFMLLPLGVYAQTVTPMPPIPTASPLTLPFNLLTSGMLSEQGDQAVYHFEIPAGQDVVVTYDSDHVIFGRYCVQVTSASNTVEDCPAIGAGGDGDGPVIGHLFFAGDDDPDTRRTVELIIARPLEGSAFYQLLAYPLTPRQHTLGMVTSAPAPPTAQPFHSYTFQANPTLPFTFAIADNTSDGDFLWAAFEPYKPGLFTVSDDLLPVVQRVDGASVSGGGAVEILDIYYLGGDTFRALVKSLDAYALRSNAVELTPLEAGETASVTLSYRDPLKVVRLSSDAAGAIAVQLDVVDGAGGFAYVYTAEQEFPVTFQLPSSQTPEAQRLTTIELGNSAAGRFVVVQIPFTHTRAPVTVEVEWETQA